MTKVNKTKVEIEHVEVYVMVSGDYCAFHEMSLRAVYDVTNNESIDSEYTLEELENWDGDGYSDVSIESCIKIGDSYYLNL